MKNENNFEDISLKLKDISTPSFILTGQFYDLNIIDNLKIKIKNHVQNSFLNYSTNVKGLFSGFDSLVNDQDFTKFILTIKKSIKYVSNYNFKINECWGNILKKNDEVIEHAHGNDGFSGILYLTDDGPGTYFSQYEFCVEEKIGRFVLFSPFLMHSVKKIDKDIERFTLAFNATKIKPWDSIEENKIHKI